jgi:hypothetical protein
LKHLNEVVRLRHVQFYHLQLESITLEHQRLQYLILQCWSRLDQYHWLQQKLAHFLFWD